VKRERFEALDAALGELRRQAEEVRAEGPLSEIKALRTFEAGSRVAARLEISTGGWLRGREAGIDVMGDGTVVAYVGGVRRRELESTEDFAYDAMSEYLAGG
jgi:hypothetical protein